MVLVCIKLEDNLRHQGKNGKKVFKMQGVININKNKGEGVRNKYLHNCKPDSIFDTKGQTR